MNSPSPSRVRRVLLVGGVLLAHALFDILVSKRPGLVSAATVGVWFSQPALLAVWAALGPGSWLRIPRMILLVAAGVALVASSKSPPANDTETLVVNIIFFAISLLLFGVFAMLRGWRLIPAEVQDRRAAAQWRQSSLREILLLIATAALVLALWRHLPSPLSFAALDVADPTLLAFGAFMFVQLVPMVGLAIDYNRRHTGWWMIAAINVVACTGLLLWRLPGPFDAPGAIMVAVSGASTSAFASFFVIRLAGYRLVRVRDLPDVSPG